MFEKATSGRDAFTFSLKGMTTIASFTIVPALADDRLNNAWDERLDQAHGHEPREDQPQEDQPEMTREIEDFLARYFAPGWNRAA